LEKSERSEGQEQQSLFVVERFGNQRSGEGSLKTVIIGRLEKGEILCYGKTTGSDLES